MKKCFNKLKILTNSLFYGLKGADEVIKPSTTDNDGQVIEAQQTKEDMYQYYKQQEHKYEYYKILREADKYDVNVNISGDIDGDFEMSATARKKTPLDYVCKIDVYNPEKLPLKLIQDNKFVLLHSNFEYIALTSSLSGEKDYTSIFNFKRNDFTPRFKLENYIKKIVVRTINEKEYYLDMYTSCYASQFGKVDAIFVSQLKKLYDTKDKKSDITDIEEISFTTDKAHGIDDMCTLKFNNIQYEDINIFDGNYVLTFKCLLSDFEDIVEKYKVEEMDKKWEEKAPRENKDIDLFAITRKMEKENENCN